MQAHEEPWGHTSFCGEAKRPAMLIELRVIINDDPERPPSLALNVLFFTEVSIIINTKPYLRTVVAEKCLGGILGYNFRIEE